MDTQHFSREQVLALCNGTFPYGNGFSWHRVDHFRLEDGVLQPYSGYGEILPGPGLNTTITERT